MCRRLHNTHRGKAEKLRPSVRNIVYVSSAVGFFCLKVVLDFKLRCDFNRDIVLIICHRAAILPSVFSLCCIRSCSLLACVAAWVF